MAESSGHAPGHDISGEGGAVRQRYQMGEGGGPMGGNFGVQSLHEANKSGGKQHGTGDDGKVLKDGERSGPPGIKHSGGDMRATAHSHHGPH